MNLNLSLGAKVKIIGSAYDRATGMVDSHMFGASLYHPDEGVALGCGMELETAIRYLSITVRPMPSFWAVN